MNVSESDAEHVRMVYGTNTEFLGLWSDTNEFGSAFVVRTRRTLNGEKLLIDITEAYHHKTPNHMYAIKLARASARRFGAASADFSVLTGWHSTRKVSDASGTLHPVNLLRQTFVFTATK